MDRQRSPVTPLKQRTVQRISCLPSYANRPEIFLRAMLLLVFVCLVGLSNSLLEKDIGKHEVYFQNVGYARDAHFYVTPQRKRTVITSEGGVLASLVSKTGAIGVLV